MISMYNGRRAVGIQIRPVPDLGVRVARSRIGVEDNCYPPRSRGRSRCGITVRPILRWPSTVNPLGKSDTTFTASY